MYMECAMAQKYVTIDGVSKNINSVLRTLKELESLCVLALDESQKMIGKHTCALD